jgi:hypothetical protein
MAILQGAQRGPGYQPQAPITYLSKDITLSCLLHLPGNQVARLQLVSTYFWHVVTSAGDNLWKRLAQQDFPSRAIPSNILPMLHYQKCFVTEQNWKNGRYVYQRLNNCGKALFLSGHQIFCEGPDLSIQIWNLNNLTCQTLIGFPGENSLDINMQDAEVLICGSDTGPNGEACFKVWDKTTGRLLWEGGRLHNLILDEDKLIITRSDYNFTTGVSIGRIDVCDKKTGHLSLKILDPDLNYTFSIRLKGKHIFASPSGTFVKYWNKETGAFVCQVGSAQDPLTSYEMDGTLVVCGFKNGKVRILNQENGTVINEFADLAGEEIVYLLVDEEVIFASTSTWHASWNKVSGDLLFKIKADPPEVPNNIWDRCTTKLFLKGTRIIWNRNLETIEIRNKYTGAVVKYFQAGRLLRDDGKHIFSVHQSVLKIWNICSGEIVKTFSKDEILWVSGVFGDRMIIQYPNLERSFDCDIYDFSANPEIPFPHVGQLPALPKP